MYFIHRYKDSHSQRFVNTYIYSSDRIILISSFLFFFFLITAHSKFITFVPLYLEYSTMEKL